MREGAQCAKKKMGQVPVVSMGVTQLAPLNPQALCLLMVWPLLRTPGASTGVSLSKPSAWALLENKGYGLGPGTGFCSQLPRCKSRMTHLE